MGVKRPKPQPEMSRGVRPSDLQYRIKRLEEYTNTVHIDGVDYTRDQIRSFIQQRYTLADENTRIWREVERWKDLAETAQAERRLAHHQIERLKTQLRQADFHLKARTAALVRIIASTRKALR